MAGNCKNQALSCAERAGRLLADGTPDQGADNMYVTSAMTTLTATPEIEAGDEFVVKNACGAICFTYQGPDTIKRIGVELTLCTPDPELSELLGGGVVLAASGGRTGWGFPYLNDQTRPLGISFELWTNQFGSDGLPDPTYPYAHWAIPRLILTPGAKTFGNEAQLNVFTGRAYENDNWGDGPANDWPVASDRSIQWIESASIPTPTCGFQSIAVS